MITPMKGFPAFPTPTLPVDALTGFENGYDFVKKLRSAKRGKENGVPDIVYKYFEYKAFELQAGDYVELGTAKEYQTWIAQNNT